MKRYLVFFGLCYYPCGGIEDLVGDVNTIEKGIELINSKLLEDYEESFTFFDSKEEYLQSELYNCWAHIYDCELRKIVYKCVDGELKNI